MRCKYYDAGRACIEKLELGLRFASETTPTLMGFGESPRPSLSARKASDLSVVLGLHQGAFFHPPSPHLILRATIDSLLVMLG